MTVLQPASVAAAARGHRALKAAAAAWSPAVGRREEGRVLAVRDGVLRIVGLPSARVEELIEVGQGLSALVLGLSQDGVQAAILDDGDQARVGQRARCTGRLATLPVGDPVLGRILDPMGRPLDGRPIVGTRVPMRLEREAPGIHARGAVHQPLYTGTLAIDAMFPIGRGQRELIIGDEGTGRSSLAMTAMLRQRDTGVICVYVAIGRRRAEVWQVAEALRAGGIRFVVVSAPEDGSAATRTLAPFAGTAVAEFFRDRGEHALVVYDDLTAHAVAWRELSLLLERPPGREAFPGDVFYLHARLLERSTQLSAEAGGGSLTALPLATTEDGRLSAYVPTNLIAITDGQVVLSRGLFASGQKPAVDAGLSVSRVGARAQAQAFRHLAGRLRLDYASFLELESFARVGTRLEASAQRRLEVGRRLRRLLQAPRLAPQGVIAQLLRLSLASQSDLLMRIPEDRVSELAAAMEAELPARLAGLAARLEAETVLSAGDEATLAEAVARWVEARLLPEATHG